MSTTEEKVDPPNTHVDWHCRKCGHQHESERPAFSYPGRCPECGEGGVLYTYPKLPTNRAWCDSEPQQYSLTGGDKKIQVYLEAATGERAGVTLDPDYVPDCDENAIYVADQVLDVLENRYIYHGGKDRVKSILAAMRACEKESDANERKNEVHHLRKTIVESAYRYRQLIEEANEGATQ